MPQRVTGVFLPWFFLTNIAYGATFSDLISTIQTQIVKPLLALLVSVATLVFIYGVVEMIANAGSEQARTKGKQHIIWGLIGLTIMVGVWGIVNIIMATLCGSGGCPTSLQ